MVGPAASPPTPPLLFRLFAELFESSLLRTSWGGCPGYLFFLGIDMPSYFNHQFSTPVNQPASYLFGYVTHHLLVMLGMLVGHAGDVENDAGDVGGLVL